MAHHAVGMDLQVRLGVDCKVDNLFIRHLVGVAQSVAEETRPVTDPFLDAKGGPPFGHGPFIQGAAVILQKGAALGKHLVLDHLFVFETEVSSLLQDDLNVARRLGVNHLVSHVGGEVALEFRMALEEREVALVGATMEVIDLGDKAVPVLPENADRFHRKGSLSEFPVKSPLEQPAVYQTEHHLP